MEDIKNCVCENCDCENCDCKDCMRTVTTQPRKITEEEFDGMLLELAEKDNRPFTITETKHICCTKNDDKIECLMVRVAELEAFVEKAMSNPMIAGMLS